MPRIASHHDKNALHNVLALEVLLRFPLGSYCEWIGVLMIAGMFSRAAWLQDRMPHSKPEQVLQQCTAKHHSAPLQPYLEHLRAILGLVFP